ncbi:hypothetical protein, partial [Saccharopolyspora sp. NPDC003762]
KSPVYAQISKAINSNVYPVLAGQVDVETAVQTGGLEIPVRDLMIVLHKRDLSGYLAAACSNRGRCTPLSAGGSSATS